MTTADYIGKEVEVRMDRPLGTKHSKYDWSYLINYGFIENTIQGDGEELDAYVIGPKEPLKKFKGKCVAYIERLDDTGDYKLIVVSEDFENISDEDILKAVNFQEQWFSPVVKRE
jgi:inorganic pyrophosphatase